MNTFNLSFRQASLYGGDWDAELVNIPESAIVFKYDIINERQQQWYIVVPSKDLELSEDREDICIFGHGCTSVHLYDLFDYTIIHLNNIMPLGEWPDVGNTRFEEFFSDTFKDCYIYVHTQDKYEIVDIDALSVDFKKIEEGKLISALKINALSGDASLTCTRVNINDPLKKQPDFYIDKTEICLYTLDPNAHDPFKLKYILSRDGEIYKNTFIDVAKTLF